MELSNYLVIRRTDGGCSIELMTRTQLLEEYVNAKGMQMHEFVTEADFLANGIEPEYWESKDPQKTPVIAFQILKVVEPRPKTKVVEWTFD